MQYWITPSLALTDDAMDDIMDSDTATTAIQLGGDALVASTEDVYRVLTNLGLGDDEIANKIDFAMGLR